MARAKAKSFTEWLDSKEGEAMEERIRSGKSVTFAMRAVFDAGYKAGHNSAMAAAIAPFAQAERQENDNG